MAADNIAMAVYLTAIMIIPAQNIVAASQKRDFTASSPPGSDDKAPQQQGIIDGLLFALVAYRQNEPAASAHTLCLQLAFLQFACHVWSHLIHAHSYAAACVTCNVFGGILHAV